MYRSHSRTPTFTETNSSRLPVRCWSLHVPMVLREHPVLSLMKPLLSCGECTRLLRLEAACCCAHTMPTACIDYLLCCTLHPMLQRLCDPQSISRQPA